ncbi:hypothetical protein CC78DRAFT_533129 [Lojkania enalia]|uniref:Uncharacterized protein n=1 Tax=Lojkania enalia TaxID=147567 RepID=A0A9P4N6C7_9PLEO|nr:hypothetical protein CC78DRAFT_533129 [Didymosphaeria enalia]
MSILRTLAARRSPLVSCQIARCAGLHQSIVRSSGKETTLHHEGRAEDIEKEKDDMLKKQNEGQGHWRESLASDSESIVRLASADTLRLRTFLDGVVSNCTTRVTDSWIRSKQIEAKSRHPRKTSRHSRRRLLKRQRLKRQRNEGGSLQ